MSDATTRWTDAAIGELRSLGASPTQGCAWLLSVLPADPLIPDWVAEMFPTEPLAATSPRLDALAGSISVAERSALSGSEVQAAEPNESHPAPPSRSRPSEFALPPSQVSPADALGLIYEALLSADHRKGAGSHFTPRMVATLLSELAIPVPIDRPPRGAVLDPACGGGAFLLAAARRLRSFGAAPASIAGALRGVDIDPQAANTARVAVALLLASWGYRCEQPPLVEVDDFLEPARRDGAAVVAAPRVVLGNPPFLTPLRNRTRGSSRSGAKAYTDAAMVFLDRCVELVEPGGRVVLVLPRSAAAARDGDEIRVRVDARCEVEAVWVDHERSFAAAVNVWAPILRRRIPSERGPEASGAGFNPGRLTVATGTAVQDRFEADPSRREAGRWGWYLARAGGVPEWACPGDARRLGDHATATAGFRDEFYACAAATVEGESPSQPELPFQPESLSQPEPPWVVTSGLIEPGGLRWGARTARINKVRFDRPVLDASRLAAHELDERGRMTRWVSARLRPKCLLAVQTNLLEAAVDPEGRCVPITPVISVEPLGIEAGGGGESGGSGGPPIDSFALLAALSSPAATLWAHEHSAGSGMALGTIRVPPRLLGGLPVPADLAEWIRCGEELRSSWLRGGGYGGAGVEPQVLVDVARRMGQALEVAEPALDWFETRLRSAVKLPSDEDSV